MARRAWDFSIGIISMMKACTNRMVPWKELDWYHGIFGKKIPSSLGKVYRIWPLLRGITLWTMWIERNDLTVNNSRWDEHGTSARPL